MDIGRVLVDAGFRMLEVPLNSPQPFESIRRMVDALGEGILIGAGTVLDPAHVTNVADAGGRLIVMPHADVHVIRAAKQAGLYCVPGVATPTEAFARLAAGADTLMVGITFLTLLNGIGNANTFWLYAALNAVFIVLTYWLVPETKGVTLEQIERNLMGGKRLRDIGR